VIVCSSDGKTPGPQEREKLAAALDRAHGEISELEDISPERRSEILEALRREMAQVRSGGSKAQAEAAWRCNGAGRAFLVPETRIEGSDCRERWSVFPTGGRSYTRPE
jgi:hypothetical protein